MKTTFKKALSVMLSAIMLLAIIPMSNAFAVDAENPVIASGTCAPANENIAWTLYDDGQLVFTGTGEIPQYVDASPEWAAYCEDIRIITINEGITGIGYDAFYFTDRCYYKVNLPESLEHIDYGAFSCDTTDWSSIFAVCYAGSEAEWLLVEHRYYEAYYEYNEYDEIVYSSFSLVETWYDAPLDPYLSRMYFDGNQPTETPYVEMDIYNDYIEYGTATDIDFFYYSAGYENLDFRFGIEGDCFTAGFYDWYISVYSTGKGEITVWAELYDENGELLDSATDTITSNSNIFIKIAFYIQLILDYIYYNIFNIFMPY